MSSWADEDVPPVSVEELDAADERDGIVEVGEYGIMFSDGEMKLMADDPEVEAIWPLHKRIEAHKKHGGRVFRRIVIVVADWAEVL